MGCSECYTQGVNGCSIHAGAAAVSAASHGARRRHEYDASLAVLDALHRVRLAIIASNGAPSLSYTAPAQADLGNGERPLLFKINDLIREYERDLAYSSRDSYMDQPRVLHEDELTWLAEEQGRRHKRFYGGGK